MKQIKLTYNGYEQDEMYIEVCFSDNLVARAYYDGEKMKGVPMANGGGYNKTGVILSDTLNMLAGETICFNAGQGEGHTIETARNFGIKVEHVSKTKSGTLYKFTNLNAEGV